MVVLRYFHQSERPYVSHDGKCMVPGGDVVLGGELLCLGETACSHRHHLEEERGGTIQYFEREKQKKPRPAEYSKEVLHADTILLIMIISLVRIG